MDLMPDLVHWTHDRRLGSPSASEGFQSLEGVQWTKEGIKSTTLPVKSTLLLLLSLLSFTLAGRGPLDIVRRAESHWKVKTSMDAFAFVNTFHLIHKQQAAEPGKVIIIISISFFCKIYRLKGIKET